MDVVRERTPLFSIIVPVYNNECDLSKCICSILGQSCSNFELILVDDGSTDHSPEICDRFADKDTRVRVIHGDNQGTAAARNTGLFSALGEYVCYVDGDDWIAPELLEKAERIFDKMDSIDLLIYRYVEILEDGSRLKKELKVKEGLYDKERLKREVYPDMICEVRGKIGVGIDSGSLCDKIIKREFLKKHYCRDLSLFRGEDSVCAWECLYYADGVFFLDSGMYFYNRLSVSSNQKKYHSDLYENNKAVVQYLRKYLNAKENSEIERQINAFECQVMVGVFEQEVSFRDSIRESAVFLKKKLKYEKRVIICPGRRLPFRTKIYILLLNLRCFSFLLLYSKIKK